MIDYNAKLNDRIKRTFITQEAFAASVGTQRQVVSMVINGRFNLTADEQARWAAALDTTIELLWPETPMAIQEQS